MDPDVVVMGEVKSDRRAKVLHLLAECVRETCEAPHAHPHGQVLPLDVAGRNVPEVRGARNRAALGTH